MFFHFYLLYFILVTIFIACIYYFLFDSESVSALVRGKRRVSLLWTSGHQQSSRETSCLLRGTIADADSGYN